MDQSSILSNLGFYEQPFEAESLDIASAGLQAVLTAAATEITWVELKQHKNQFVSKNVMANGDRVMEILDIVADTKQDEATASGREGLDPEIEPVAAN